MEYAGSYALYNYRLADPGAGLSYSNLRLIRAFEHGLDSTSSEAGFVLVHIDMARNSGPLVAGTTACFDTCAKLYAEGKEKQQRGKYRVAFNEGLKLILEATKKINSVMDTMWSKSKPGSYTSFRTFIFGITSQSMFPHGVVYEGVNDGKPMSFRGESGANDSIIPLMDNFLQIPMPDTPLTEILSDFREYRPSNHRAFLLFAKERSLDLGLRDYALDISANATGGRDNDDEQRESVAESRRLWLQILNQVRDFRWRHWCFAREYILKRTGHPTATGGSPIVTWLPNQLQAVLKEMENVYRDIGGEDLGEECRNIMDLVSRQKEMVRKEVAKYCAERGVPISVV
jgi:indoleamine 2,3-dioxygenase